MIRRRGSNCLVSRRFLTRGRRRIWRGCNKQPKNPTSPTPSNSSNAPPTSAKRTSSLPLVEVNSAPSSRSANPTPQSCRGNSSRSTRGLRRQELSFRGGRSDRRRNSCWIGNSRVWLLALYLMLIMMRRWSHSRKSRIGRIRCVGMISSITRLCRQEMARKCIGRR